MKVPFFDLSTQFQSIEHEVRAAVDRVLGSQRFILGPEVDRFEQQIAELTQAQHAIGVSSGSDALLCSLMAAGFGPGDEVIVPPFSFFATVGCVLRVFATPVFVDIDPATCNLDASQVRAAITPRTRAILVVHLFGQCADMDPLLEVAADHGAVVIEDAAQALGATYKGRSAGTLGHLGCFSFFPTKNLGACGDAGAIVTNDETLADRCRKLRCQGASPKYHHPMLGGNFRLDAIQAAILGAKLSHLDDWTRARATHAAAYDAAFSGTDIKPLRIEAHCETVHHQYVVRVPQRDRVRGILRDRGIGTEVYYPEPLHLQPCLQSYGFEAGGFPEAEKAAREVLALPIYPELTAEMRDQVAGSLIEAVSECGCASMGAGP